MTRSWRSWASSTLLVGGLWLASPAVAHAQQAPAASLEDQQKAQEHFQRAKDHYQAGRYNEAVQELEAARALDPKAKDLVFNLGIVHEKLGKFDEAIADFHQYIEMEGVTSQEKSKAESIIKRIEGAKREVAPQPGAGGAAEGTAGGPAQGDHGAQPKRESPARGRIDGATIAAGSVAAVGLAVGTIFGIRALALRPTSFVTGRDGTYADFQQQNDAAHTSAIVADVGFGVGIVAAVVTAWLYFGRTKEPSRTGLFVGPGMLAGSFR